MKPVVWNTRGYLRPSGAKFGSGYPAETGFGVEEWNNSPRLTLADGGELKHVFHTEGFGNQPLDEAAGEVFVFMVASHLGKQYLVAIAGRTTSLFTNRRERHRLFDKIKERSHFPKEAWELSTVRKAHGNNYTKLLSRWKKERDWFVTWICPADHYLGLSQRVELKAQEITGRRRLVSMYGAYQEIDRLQAVRILDRIPEGEDQYILANLKDACGHANTDIVTDLRGLDLKSRVKPTTRLALIDARLGQGSFRRQLEYLWGGKCVVTGCSVPELLRASHVKPWRSSSNKERLDPKNGLLLTAHLDALFDSGLITFDDNGVIVRSSRLSDDGDPRLHLDCGISAPLPNETKEYLRHHREKVFRR